jgi:hypothetical protein
MRKGTEIPYISHLTAVAGIVLEHGGTEEEAIAALLHDAVEDQGGKPILEWIRRRFGTAVADIVDGCTDTCVEPKPDWRKRTYGIALTDAEATYDRVVQGGRALAYSLGDDDVLFRQTYPGYQPLASVGPPAPLGSYANRYAIWAQTSLDTTQGILRGSSFQGKLLATEQGVLGILRALSAGNLLNRNDAINLTGQLAAEQVAQLQKLRELQLEDMTSKAAYQGYQVQKDADMVATEQQFFGQTAIHPGDSRVFPTTP